MVSSDKYGMRVGKLEDLIGDIPSENEYLDAPCQADNGPNTRNAWWGDVHVNGSREGTKHDSGKARFDLLPAFPLEQMAHLYTFGAKKYADRNWEKGISYSRIFAALMRHAWAFWRGEDNDPEHKLHHMTSVAWCAFALVEYWHKKREDLDDRPKS
jgi:hypothetical protein